MKIKVFLTVLLISLSVSFSFAQTIHPFMKPTGSLADVKSGGFSTIEAGFSVDLPKQISGAGGTNSTGGVQYKWRLTEGFYTAGIDEREADVENSASFEAETLKVVDGTFAQMARDLFASKFEVAGLEKKFIEQQGHKGIQVRAALTDTVVLIRAFWVKNRAYRMGVVLTKEQQKFESAAQKVFDSFKVYSKESYDELIRKKIEENTPSPLPQTPVAAKSKSDLEDENLKGKVKSVVEERQNFKDGKADGARYTSVEKIYNEQGNLTKQISYNNTKFPSSIKVFGYIDGNRVSVTNYIAAESSPPPPAPMAMPSGTPKKFDSRYQVKYIYKYDEANNLSELLFYSNSGEMTSRTVYARTGSKIEETVYRTDSTIERKNFRVVNDKGETIEESYPVKRLQEEYQYRHRHTFDEYDNKGNWTKRTTIFSKITNGTETVESSYITFRKIIYY